MLKIKKVKFIIPFFLFLLIGLSQTSYNFGVESSIAEILQLIVLFCCMGIILINKKIFLNYCNIKIYIIKILFFLFFLYEELSFITRDLISNLSLINSQSEINFHRLLILYENFFNLKFPFYGYEINVTYRMFFYTISLLILGYGLYVPFLKKIKFLFFEKEIAPYTFVYLINLFIMSIKNQIFNNFYLPTMDPELLELFIYLLFLFDLNLKLKILIKSNQ